MAVPYTFGTATAAIPLSQLDSNFATTITLGNTAIQLGNTVTTLNNMTLANVTVSSGNLTLTNVSATLANVTTANIGTAVITGTSTLTGLTASTALALDASKNIASVTNTGTGNNVLATSPTITTPTISTITSAASTALTLQSAGTTAVTVDTSQNVGIGTSSPIRKLQISASGVVEFVLQDTSQAANSRNWRIYNASNSLVMGTLNDAGTAGTDMVKLDSSGNFYVSANGSSNPGISMNPSGYMGLGNSAGGSGFGFITFYRSGANIGNITQNGTTAVAYNTSSDYRLKDNIAPMTGALAKVAALKPCTYTWKSAPNEVGEGFIAHELAEVCPHAVTGEKDAVDEDGNPKYQGIDTSFLVATLTAAIQELSAKNDALEARLTVLEAK